MACRYRGAAHRFGLLGDRLHRCRSVDLDPPGSALCFSCACVWDVGVGGVVFVSWRVFCGGSVEPPPHISFAASMSGLLARWMLKTWHEYIQHRWKHGGFELNKLVVAVLLAFAAFLEGVDVVL